MSVLVLFMVVYGMTTSPLSRRMWAYAGSSFLGASGACVARYCWKETEWDLLWLFAEI